MLGEQLGDRLQPVFLMPRRNVDTTWATRLPPGRPPLHYDELFPARVPLGEKVARRIDMWLDERIGFVPIAIRFNYRHGFHLERMRPGHGNAFLDCARVGPLPRHPVVDAAMTRWHFSTRRYVSRTLVRRLTDEAPAIVLPNLQMKSVVPFIRVARRLGLPLIGTVASWDHAVGKGVIWPGFDRYLVQNDRMRSELVRYHGIDARRVVVTGWAQTDVFHRLRPREDFERIVASYGLEPGKPVVLVMGNTPTNTPDEARFFERLTRWRVESGEAAPSLLFRPHPRDRDWRTRFAAPLDAPGCAVQEPSVTDLDVLATLLQHADCVVTNAGTVMLDALVNDRPVVCVLYDEGGGPPAESWAAKSIIGEHYRDLAESGAFVRAETFVEVVEGIRRCLAAPDECAAERRRVVDRVVGPVDGKAAERYVDAVLGGLVR